jgi:hypothetical protein
VARVQSGVADSKHEMAQDIISASDNSERDDACSCCSKHRGTEYQVLLTSDEEKTGRTCLCKTGLKTVKGYDSSAIRTDQ